jgi:hypothetical protein
MDSTQFKPPGTLSFHGNISENWRRWKQKLDVYMLATESAKKDDEIKVAILLHCIGDKGVEIYNTFAFDNDNAKKFGLVCENFN